MLRSQLLLKKLKNEIREVTPQEAQALQEAGSPIIDIRSPDEIAMGTVRDAAQIPRDSLELKIESHVKNVEQPVVLMCGGGNRSLLAAHNLKQMGFDNVMSMSGGFSLWKQLDLPVDYPFILSAEERQRYARHLNIPEVGEAGQIKLAKAKVLLVGAGGLGSPAAFYLAAAGVGTIGIIDHDYVDRSNLQRQILHTDSRVGQPKVDSARETLLALNPLTNVISYQEKLTAKNIENIFAQYDIILDGSDNFPTRYLVNDACVNLSLPNVHGSIFRFDGQVSVFWAGNNGKGPCYRCLYPEPPPAEFAPSCAEAGVLGVLPGVIGVLEATETIKLILNVGESLVGRLLHFDALQCRFREFTITPDPMCSRCSTPEIKPYSDYQGFCGLQ